MLFEQSRETTFSGMIRVKREAMKELLYFAFADLMVRVESDETQNTLQYATHRKMTLSERTIIEQYLLTKVAPKLKYYTEGMTSQFSYLGVDETLLRDLNLFQIKNALQARGDTEAASEAAVKQLIRQSMASYYGEKIGEKLIELREAMSQSRAHFEIRDIKDELRELVLAYNAHSEKKIDLETLLPTDFQKGQYVL